MSLRSFVHLAGRQEESRGGYDVWVCLGVCNRTLIDSMGPCCLCFFMNTTNTAATTTSTTSRYRSSSPSCSFAALLACRKHRIASIDDGQTDRKIDTHRPRTADRPSRTHNHQSTISSSSSCSSSILFLSVLWSSVSSSQRAVVTLADRETVYRSRSSITASPRPAAWVGIKRSKEQKTQ